MSKPPCPFIQSISLTTKVPLQKLNQYQGESNSNNNLLPQKVISTGIPLDQKNRCALELKKLISKHGKIPFSQFMDVCLYGKSGYYTEGKVTIGDVHNQNDFITSSESSIFFGEAIGIIAYNTWKFAHKPNIFTILEIGGGNGGMANGILRWAEKTDPSFYAAINYTIIEVSKALITRQQSRLSSFLKKVSWIHSSIHDIGVKPLTGCIIFNELMDAFPVERVAKINGKIMQKFISLDDKYIWTEVWETPTDEVRAYLQYLKNELGYALPLQPNTEEPINPQALSLQRKLDRTLQQGVILNIDYGMFGNVGEGHTSSIGYLLPKTLQEKMNNYDTQWAGYVAPGFADITSQINFVPLASQAEKDGLHVTFQGIQSKLLIESGITKYIREEYRNMRKLSLWESFADFCQELQGFFDAVNPQGGGNYFCLLTTKGLPINAKLLQTRKSNNSFLEFPAIKIQMGKANEKITCTSDSNMYELVSEKDGYITLPPIDAQNLKIVIPHCGKPIYLRELGEVFFSKKQTMWQRFISPFF